jgi:hypothetical protein
MQGWRKSMEDSCITESLDKSESGKYKFDSWIYEF